MIIYPCWDYSQTMLVKGTPGLDFMEPGVGVGGEIRADR